MFFEARSVNRSELPLVLWMTGGPGCSSELAIFYGTRPSRPARRPPGCSAPSRAPGRAQRTARSRSRRTWSCAKASTAGTRPRTSCLWTSRSTRASPTRRTRATASTTRPLSPRTCWTSCTPFLRGSRGTRGARFSSPARCARAARRRGAGRVQPAGASARLRCLRRAGDSLHLAGGPGPRAGAERGARAPPASVRHAWACAALIMAPGGAELRGSLRARGQRRHPGPQPRPRRPRGHQPGRHRDRQRAHRPGQAVQPVRRLQRVQGPHRRDPAGLHQHGAPAAAPRAASGACTAAAAAEARARAPPAQFFPVCNILIRTCNSFDFSPLCYLALLVCQQTVVGPIQARAQPPHRWAPPARASAASARGDSRSRRAAASRMRRRLPCLVHAAALPGRHKRRRRGGDSRCAGQAAGGNFNVYDVRKARPRRAPAQPPVRPARTRGPTRPPPRARSASARSATTSRAWTTTWRSRPCARRWAWAPAPGRAARPTSTATCRVRARPRAGAG